MHLTKKLFKLSSKSILCNPLADNRLFSPCHIAGLPHRQYAQDWQCDICGLRKNPRSSTTLPLFVHVKKNQSFFTNRHIPSGRIRFPLFSALYPVFYLSTPCQNRSFSVCSPYKLPTYRHGETTKKLRRNYDPDRVRTRGENETKIDEQGKPGETKRETLCKDFRLISGLFIILIPRMEKFHQRVTSSPVKRSEKLPRHFRSVSAERNYICPVEIPYLITFLLFSVWHGLPTPAY